MLSMFCKSPKSALFQKRAPFCAESGSKIMWLLCLQSVMSWHIISCISHSKSHSSIELWPHKKLLQHSFKGEIQGLQACIANSVVSIYLQKDMSSMSSSGRWSSIHQVYVSYVWTPCNFVCVILFLVLLFEHFHDFRDRITILQFFYYLNLLK